MSENKNYLSSAYDYLIPLKTDLIRIGKDKDGGYVMGNNELKKIELIISLGMGSEYENWSFEEEYLKKKQLKVIFYDHTVSVKNYLLSIFRVFRRLIKLRYKFKDLIEIFKNYFSYLTLLKNKRIYHYRKKICEYPKNNQETNIEEIFSKVKTKQVLLKVDIEGSEYEIIDQITSFSDKIVSLIIEFHEIDKFENIFQKKIAQLKSKFEIIHIHGNNNTGILESKLPKTLELTFVNKETFRGIKNEHVYDFPIDGLDFPNNPNFKDIYFSFKNN